MWFVRLAGSTHPDFVLKRRILQGLLYTPTQRKPLQQLPKVQDLRLYPKYPLRKCDALPNLFQRIVPATSGPSISRLFS